MNDTLTTDDLAGLKKTYGKGVKVYINCNCCDYRILTVEEMYDVDKDGNETLELLLVADD